MSNDQAKLIAHRERHGAEAAIVFIHGFSGDPAKTWGQFPSILGQAPGLEQWDIFSLGYNSGLSPDVRGVWAADPGLPTLATYLRTRCDIKPLNAYKALVLVAHSMGGLVVQRALVDDSTFSKRISRVFFFGTPSAGIKKAGLFGFLKPQLGNMADDSAFISDLRARWDKNFGNARPFDFWTVAGDRDQFVPPESSLVPFPENNRLVVLGNHLEIVKPDDVKSMSVQVTVKGVIGEAGLGGPWNAARVAVETHDFQRAIDLLLPHASELDDRHVVELALALDSMNRQAEAIKILQSHAAADTDVHGVLAGRLKRRWQIEGRKADAESALALYSAAYETSVQAGRADQAFYHGINVAFLKLAYANDPKAAATFANEVIKHCAAAVRDYWCVATEAEARLYIGNLKDALATYREAVGWKNPVPKPRELQSTYSQAWLVAGILKNDKAQSELDEIFKH